MLPNKFTQIHWDHAAHRLFNKSNWGKGTNPHVNPIKRCVVVSVPTDWPSDHLVYVTRDQRRENSQVSRPSPQFSTQCWCGLLRLPSRCLLFHLNMLSIQSAQFYSSPLWLLCPTSALYNWLNPRLGCSLRVCSRSLHPISFSSCSLVRYCQVSWPLLGPPWSLVAILQPALYTYVQIYYRLCNT